MMYTYMHYRTYIVKCLKKKKKTISAVTTFLWYLFEFF